jgi:hypothetical protein
LQPLPDFAGIFAPHAFQQAFLFPQPRRPHGLRLQGLVGFRFLPHIHNMQPIQAKGDGKKQQKARYGSTSGRAFREAVSCGVVHGLS